MSTSSKIFMHYFIIIVILFATHRGEYFFSKILIDNWVEVSDDIENAPTTWYANFELAFMSASYFFDRKYFGWIFFASVLMSVCPIETVIYCYTLLFNCYTLLYYCFTIVIPIIILNSFEWVLKMKSAHKKYAHFACAFSRRISHFFRKIFWAKIYLRAI